MANEGMLMLAALGALLFLGGKRKGSEKTAEETQSDLLTPAVISGASVASDGTETIVAANVIDVGGLGAEQITPTELAVRRSEQITKQAMDWGSGTIGAPLDTGITQADIDTIEIAQGTYVYAGSPRPTSTAMPVWNTKYGWYWVNPPTGLAVGPGGREWSSGDTTVNMGSAGTNIGKTLPPGWTRNPGGSADYTGVYYGGAEDE